MTAPGRLAEALRTGRFAVTAEVAPPRGADVTRLRETARLLRGWVDAANVTDNQGARVRMSSLAGSAVLLAEGLDPVMQMTCRDRNRIALQSDLLAAGGLGVPNVLLMTGDRPERGDHPDAPGVFDLDSDSLTAAARALRDDGTLLSGQTVDPAPRYLSAPVLADDPLVGGSIVVAGESPRAAAVRAWLAADDPVAGPGSGPSTPARASPSGWPARWRSAPSSCRPSSCSTWPRSRAGWPGCATSASPSGAACSRASGRSVPCAPWT